MYQSHIPQYWIVDLEARLIERWLPEDERPQIVTDTLEWQPTGAAAPMRLDLTRFCSRALDR